MLAADDFSLRVSSTADGGEAVQALLHFARMLSAATIGTESRRQGAARVAGRA